MSAGGPSDDRLNGPPGGHPGLETAAQTDVGRQRSENQDSFGEWSSPGRYLVAVADGMGGHQGGATASRLAIGAFEATFETLGDAPAIEFLTEAFEAANHRIYTAAQSNPQLRGMGTTGVMLLVEGSGETRQAWVAHTGDSRAYRLRAGVLEVLTHDHNLSTQLVREQRMLPEEARLVPNAGALLRALGPAQDVEVEIHPVSVEPGDRFLLCSDGLWGPVPDSETQAILERHCPEDAARVLVSEANRRGGPDNVTVAIARIPPAPDPARQAELEPRRSATIAPDWADPGPERPRRGWVIPLTAIAATLTALCLIALVLAYLDLGPAATTNVGGRPSRVGAP